MIDLEKADYRCTLTGAGLEKEIKELTKTQNSVSEQFSLYKNVLKSNSTLLVVYVGMNSLKYSALDILNSFYHACDRADFEQSRNVIFL